MLKVTVDEACKILGRRACNGAHMSGDSMYKLQISF